MKTKPSKNGKNEKESPHCRKCGGTDIDFEYWDSFSGMDVSEVGALRQAIYYVATAAKEEVDQGGSDVRALSMMGGALAELAVMLETRESIEEDHKKAAAKVQS